MAQLKMHEAIYLMAYSLDDVSVISSVFTLYCCLLGPKFPPLFRWSFNAMCCDFIMYILAWYIREERERGRVPIHPSESRSPQLSLGTVAEMKEMTTDTLQKPQVNDHKEPTMSGEGK